MGGPLDEIAFLARSEHRAGVLEALVEGPRDRQQLQAATGASSPTMGRVLAALEGRRWVESQGRAYRLTPLGAYVTQGLSHLQETMATQARLRDVWRWLPREMEGFSVEHFADAVVSHPGPGYPYEPVERVTELIEGTRRMWGFGTTVFKSINNEAVCRAVLAGMEYEYIFTPEVLEATVSWDPRRIAQAAACDHCTVLVHEDLPDRDRCGLGIFDDRIGICCHDPETGLLQAVVDTAAPEARRWALEVYRRHRSQARPLTEAERARLFPEGVLA